MNLYNLAHAFMSKGINFKFRSGTDSVYDNRLEVEFGWYIFSVTYVGFDKFAVVDQHGDSIMTLDEIITELKERGK